MKPALASPDSRVPPPAPVRVLSYWIESFDQAKKGDGKRVAEPAAPTLVSGQKFKLHFEPSAPGYLYIIGKEGDSAKTLLTEQGEILRKSNLAEPHADFGFPSGKWGLGLDNRPGTDEFIIIFSLTKLVSPAFLRQKIGYKLTSAERSELEDFRARYMFRAKTSPAQTENDADAAVVSVPDGTQNQPVVFVITIKHK
jgi:hypothetical protein